MELYLKNKIKRRVWLQVIGGGLVCVVKGGIKVMGCVCVIIIDSIYT